MNKYIYLFFLNVCLIKKNTRSLKVLIIGNKSLFLFNPSSKEILYFYELLVEAKAFFNPLLVLYLSFKA